MRYVVRVYCYDLHDVGECQHSPTHPFLLPGKFPSIAAASDPAQQLYPAGNAGVDWDVLDETGAIVC